MSKVLEINDSVMIRNMDGKIGKIIGKRRIGATFIYAIALSTFDHDVINGIIPSTIQRIEKDLSKVYSTDDKVIIGQSGYLPKGFSGKNATIICRRYSSCLNRYLYTICINETNDYFTDVSDDSFEQINYIDYPVVSKKSLDIDKVIFSNDKTIVFWEDGTKTMVSCMNGDEYDNYDGFCAAVVKKIFGSTANAQKLMSEKAFGDPDWYSNHVKNYNK